MSERRRLRLVHFLPRIRLEDGGVVRAVIDLVGALSDAGHEVTLLTLDAADAPDEWADGGPSVVTLPGPLRPGGRLGPATRNAASKQVRSADALHLHTPWEVANLGLAAIARRLGVPYLVSVHGMLDDWSMAQRSAKKRLFLALAGQRLLERASAVHCTAEAELAQASRWFPRGRGVVVPLVVDLSPFRSPPGAGEAREAFGLSPDRPVVLFLSRIHEKKGVDVLLRAFAQLRERRPEAALVIAGPGDDAYVASMRRLAADLGVADATQFVGMVGGSRKLSLYEAASVFVLPTSQENFGLVLPEAMACGTPVLTTKGVDIWPELERSGGAMIRERTPDAFAEAIELLLAEPERARAMGVSGREWTLEELDGARVVARYTALYTRRQEEAGR